MIQLSTPRSSDTLLKFRLFVYIISFVHSAATALKLFNINFDISDDPKMRQYSKMKWKLLTAWFNLLNIWFMVLCIYCDWMALKGKNESKYVKILQKIRTSLFTSILFPTTSFGDILFWQLWHVKREILMPLSTDRYISIWDQHSMHTISLVFVVFELLFVHRKRPKSLVPEIVTLFIFVSTYIFVCFLSLRNGEYVYPGIKFFSMQKLIILTIYIYISHLFYYTSQWIIRDLINGSQSVTKKLT